MDESGLQRIDKQFDGIWKNSTEKRILYPQSTLEVERLAALLFAKI